MPSFRQSNAIPFFPQTPMSTTTSSTSSSSNPTHKPPLPPGMIIGPDGKPCKICTAFRNWKPRTNASAKSASSSSTPSSTATMMAAMAAVAATPAEPERPKDCPPDVEDLGRATWTFLHTTAAYYPDNPTHHQRANMIALIRSLPILYPCSSCALDFGDDLKKAPPDVSSRTALSKWLCERHNEVNLKLGKQKFDCAKVDERWKDGPPDGRCD